MNAMLRLEIRGRGGFFTRRPVSPIVELKRPNGDGAANDGFQIRKYVKEE